MPNILDYLDWRGDISLEHYPLNDLDCLLFSVISHIDFSGIVSNIPDEGIPLSVAADLYFKQNNGYPPSMGLIVPDTIYDALEAMMTAKRYEQVKLTYFSEKVDIGKEKQFAGLTFILPQEQGIFITFRGTDDSLVGWKEDFNMSFMSIVPSQVEALKYIEVAGRSPYASKIYIGGHSKGGNLAVFGGTFCTPEVKDKIKCIYCNDAPGFSDDMVESPDFQEIKSRIIRTVPETSVVGLLLKNPVPMRVVKSNAKGLYQHDPFSWQVKGCKFTEAETLSEGSLIMKDTLDRWLEESTPEQLSQIVNSLYVFLSSTESKTLTELNANRRRLLDSMRQISPETKRSILMIVKLMTGVESKKIKSELKQRLFRQGGSD